MFIFICFPFFLFLLLPVYITLYLKPATSNLLFLFFLLNLLILVFLSARRNKTKRNLGIHFQRAQEKINILNDKINRGLKSKLAVQEKIRRYNSLKNILEDLSRNLDLDYIADNLASIAYHMVGLRQGTCMLYLADEQSRTSLSLFKTKKEDHNLVIKTKEGDIFDLWVLRHTSPLIIEDIGRDFRFDPGKIALSETRTFSSLISAPLVSEHHFLGLLRLDNPGVGFYSQDDLRLLATICDLGAVALESGELYQRTQELAIHDGLTALYRKDYFLQRLKEECRRALRQGKPLSLLMLDIDYFKNYNDQFGHMAGDMVLKDLSRNIIDFFSGLDPVIGRFGGEEFCIALPHMDKNDCLALAEKLRIKIEGMKMSLRRKETNITVSIGIATFPIDADEEGELIFKADKAMYRAKENGRNNVVNFS